MPPHVLIVDDEVPIQIMVHAILERTERFQVSVAGGGEEALQVCAAEKVDVVLMDAMMPGMDGFTACQRIKSAPATAGTRVIMCTALAQQADRALGVTAGADDYLTKPFMPSQLIAAVDHVLTKAPASPAA